MTQKYDKEFKMNAVKLYLANTETIDKIAHDLGISRASLGHWIRQYKAEGNKSFPGSGHGVEGELNALKRDLYLVRQEHDILKKAISTFAETRGQDTSL